MFDFKYHKKDLSEFRFLITGAAGFIGSNLVEYLLNYKAGHVLALDNLETGNLENLTPFLANPHLTFIKGDICDPDLCQDICKNVDYVFHEAALGSVPRSIKNPIPTNKTNIDGFVNILVAAKDQKVKRVVYAASSSTYGDSKTLPKKEEIIGRPLSPYAVTKYVNELYADVFAKIYGLETIGLRYFNVFGPKQNPEGAYAAVIPRFIRAVLSDAPITIEGDGNQTRDFTFIENVVQANILAALTDNPNAVNQVYNVAVGENISINNLFNLIARYAEKDAKAVYIEKRQGDVRDSLADISKAEKYLEYSPRYKLNDGLRETIRWFKANNI